MKFPLSFFMASFIYYHLTFICVTNYIDAKVLIYKKRAILREAFYSQEIKETSLCFYKENKKHLIFSSAFVA